MSEDLSEFVAKSAGEKTVRCEGFDWTTGTGWSQDSGTNLHQYCAPIGSGVICPTVTISGTYDNGGSMTIGGDTCHLCGARFVSRTTEDRRGKKRWKTSREVQYDCGTTVFTDSRGKNLVYVGSKCIQVKGAV